MHHCLMPALRVGGQMAHHAVEEWTAEAFASIDGTQFGTFLLRFVLNLVPLGGNTLGENLLLGASGQVASKCHRDPSSQHLAQHNYYQVSRSGRTDSHDEHQCGDQTIVEAKDNFAEPITPMWMLLI